MRAANLFLFLGTVGLLNIYEDLMGEEEGGKMDPAEANRLRKKLGVKERRSAVYKNPQGELQSHFNEFSEELVDFMKREVLQGLSDCDKAKENECNCLTLICFGLKDCTINATANVKQRQQRERHLDSKDPKYVYYAASQRLRARHSASQRMRDKGARKRRGQFLMCRQTTIDPYVLCECRKYTRLKR